MIFYIKHNFLINQIDDLSGKRGRTVQAYNLRIHSKPSKLLEATPFLQKKNSSVKRAPDMSTLFGMNIL